MANPLDLSALPMQGFRPQKHTRGKTFGSREDGTPKGNGWLGHIRTRDGKKVSTELSMGIEMDGEEVLMPLMVPTLTQQELDFLVNDTKSIDDVPEVIKRKAIDHALMQMRKGQSPFFD